MGMEKAAGSGGQNSDHKASRGVCFKGLMCGTHCTQGFEDLIFSAPKLRGWYVPFPYPYCPISPRLIVVESNCRPWYLPLVPESFLVQLATGFLRPWTKLK